MKPAEPTLAALPNPALRYLLATRPAFLSVTLFGGLAGIACAFADGLALDATAALLTIVFAMVAHAGINVLNDYYDALNGADAANTERLFPFTGGSRFIQNGVLTLRQTGRFGSLLLAAVVPAGLWLTLNSAPGLIAIGLIGLAVGWAYSAPPMALMSRGLGEVAVTAGWLTVVVGADFVQRGAFAATPFASGLGYGLLVANVLYINQFPDRRADAVAGKRTLVVRLGAARARVGYGVIALIAYGWLAAMIGGGWMPWTAALAFAAAPLSIAAARELWRHAGTPAALAPAIARSIAAANGHGALLALGLVLARVLA